MGAQVLFESGSIVDVAAPLVALLIGAFGAIAWSELAERRVRYRVTRDNELLEQRVRERTADLADAEREIAHRLGVAVEWRDAETGVHIERMGRLCERLAREVGMNVVEADLLRHASALHDVGKVGITDDILLKPGKLDPAEWATMKTHTTIGASILSGSRSELVQLAEQIALSHHERWDGSGYPQGLQGDQIPLAARICAVCDVFDALLSPRPYKDAWPLGDVITELASLRGTHLDPALVDAFLPLAADLHAECFGEDEAVAARARPPPASGASAWRTRRARLGVADRLVGDHGGGDGRGQRQGPDGIDLRGQRYEAQAGHRGHQPGPVESADVPQPEAEVPGVVERDPAEQGHRRDGLERLVDVPDRLLHAERDEHDPRDHREVEVAVGVARDADAGGRRAARGSAARTRARPRRSRPTRARRPPRGRAGRRR